MRIYLDIETAALTDDDTIEYLRSTLKPPGTLKKAESIAAWWADQAPAALAERIARAGLDAETGQIISIAVANDDDQQWVRCRGQGELESALINELFETVESWQRDEAAKLPACASAWPQDPVYPVAHNTAFDMAYLWKRCRILRVPTPDWLPSPGTRAGKYHSCTMERWCGPQGRISLDRLCKLLGVPTSKDGGITGADVGAAWLAGRYAEIAEYNLKDVIATAACWHRLNGDVA